jgi:hypothetical protein
MKDDLIIMERINFLFLNGLLNIHLKISYLQPDFFN